MGQQAPYIPEVSSPTDTSNFDVDDNDLRNCDTQPPQHNPAFSGLHLPFVGFSFTMNSKLSDLARFSQEIVASRKREVTPIKNDEVPVDGLSKNAYERRITRLEDEKKELVRKLNTSNQALQKFAHGPLADPEPTSSPDNNQSAGNEVRRLQDELNQLTKKNAGKQKWLVGLYWKSTLFIAILQAVDPELNSPQNPLSHGLKLR